MADQNQEQTISDNTVNAIPNPDVPPPPAPEVFSVSDETPEANSQFEPQMYAIPAAGDAGSTAGSPGGGLKRIFTFLIFLILLGALGIGGWYAYKAFMPKPKEDVVLTYWGLWENDAVIKPIFTAFETAHPSVKIEYFKQSQKQYRERLQSYIERGEGPDVFRFHNTWVPMLKNQLAAAPGDTMTTQVFSSTFYPVATNDLVAGSTIYGMPMMVEGLGLYVNEDLFSTAAVTPPTSWEDIVKPGGLVEKLTVKDGSNITTSAIALGTATNVENFSDIIATMIMQNGGSITNPTGKETEEALIFYRKFADPNDAIYTWNSSLDNSVFAFANNKVAMILAPSWRAFDIKQINPNLKFKIVPIPQLPGNTVTWASYWVEGVSAKSLHQKEAWELVKYMTSKDVLVKLYTEEAKTRLFGEPYSRVDLASSVASDPFVNAFIKQAGDAKSFPLASKTFDNGLNDKLIKYLEDAVNSMNNGSSSQEALNTMSAGFRQIFNQYGMTTSTAQ